MSLYYWWWLVLHNPASEKKSIRRTFLNVTHIHNWNGVNLDTWEYWFDMYNGLLPNNMFLWFYLEWVCAHAHIQMEHRTSERCMLERYICVDMRAEWRKVFHTIHFVSSFFVGFMIICIGCCRFYVSFATQTLAYNMKHLGIVSQENSLWPISLSLDNCSMT